MSAEILRGLDGRGRFWTLLISLEEELFIMI